jgi:hypothetical protein
MGDIFKKSQALNIGNPIAHHWGSGHFGSSRKGARGEFKGLADGGAGMTAKQKREYRAREAAKGGGGDLTTLSPLTSRYS